MKLYAITIMLCVVTAGMVSVLVPEEVKGEGGSGEFYIEVAWDSAPFNTIYTLCEWNNTLFAAGRYDERIYRSQDGRIWSPAFDVNTTHAWESSIVFNGSLYFGSTESRSDLWYVEVWRSQDGLSLERVYQSEAFEEKVVPSRGFDIINDRLYLTLRYDGTLLRSSDGENWKECFHSDNYDNINDITVFDDTYYMTAGSRQNGGALFRSNDMETWEKYKTWTDGTIDWHSSAGSMVVFNDELYISHHVSSVKTKIPL